MASESQRFWYGRLFLRVFLGIPIWRGRVDRRALQTVLAIMQRIAVLFPPENRGPYRHVKLETVG